MAMAASRCEEMLQELQGQQEATKAELLEAPGCFLIFPGATGSTADVKHRSCSSLCHCFGMECKMAFLRFFENTFHVDNVSDHGKELVNELFLTQTSKQILK